MRVSGCCQWAPKAGRIAGPRFPAAASPGGGGGWTCPQRATDERTADGGHSVGRLEGGAFWPQGVMSFLPPALDRHSCVSANSRSPIITEVVISPAAGSIEKSVVVIVTVSSNSPFFLLNSILIFSFASGSPREPSFLSLKTHFGPRLFFHPVAPGGMSRHSIRVAPCLMPTVTPSA